MIPSHTQSLPRASVLVADDEPAIRSILREVLTQASYHVDVAEDGQDALDGLRRRRYDAVVLDLRMPRRDGLEVLRAVRASWPDIPVIVASGGASASELETALAEGAFACITKPFSLRRMVREVRRAIESQALLPAAASSESA